MTEQEQQIAIAETMGWTETRLAIRGAGAPERKPSPYGIPPGRKYVAPLPDYLHDLNAIHSAVLRLNTEQYWRFVRKLRDITNNTGEVAEAHEACRAFLYAIGKWRDG